MGNSDLDELKDIANCHKKQIADMQAHIDCLKKELRDTQFYSDKLKQELKMKDGTKMFDILMENSSGEAKELLSRHLYEKLCCVEINQEKLRLELPEVPIDVAAMLIRETVRLKTSSIKKAFNPNAPEEYEIDKYSAKDLKEIAEHLLAYCNNQENGGDTIMDGFQLMLHNYCSYCPDFAPEVEKVDCTLLGDSTPKTMNNIRCQHEGRCVNLAENMKHRE